MMIDEGSQPRARVSSPVAATPKHATLLDALEAAAASGSPFVTIHGAKGATALDHRAALEGAWRWSSLLRRRGVERGERIPILLPTSTAFVEALLGTMMAGAIPAPLASPLTFGGMERYLRNLAAIVQSAGARRVIASARVRDAIAGDDELRRMLGDVVTDADLDDAAPLDPRQASLGASDTAFLQYTSGTTGRPKGAVISHRALLSNAFAIAHGLSIGPEDVGVSWLPLFHDMGLIGVLLTAICHPYPIHIMSPESFVMLPRRWLELLSLVGGTLSAAPNFAYDLCVARAGELRDGTDLARWRVALNGAEPVHATTIDRFATRFGMHGFSRSAMLPVYGLAESTLAVTFPDHGRGPRTLGVDRGAIERGEGVRLADAPNAHRAVSVGRPVAGTTVAIFDLEGRVAAGGQTGEIRVSGPSLMDGYFRNEQASADALSDGWLRTGDLGFLHDGELFVTGRAKELIIKAGRNVYPYDVERVASEVSGLRAGAVAAFGRTNDETGTDDLILLAETREVDPGERERMAREVRGEVLAVLGVKVDEIHFCPVGAVPRTTSGKIKRKACAAVVATEAPA